MAEESSRALTPAMFEILLALADGERHGYGIMMEVAANTEGAMRLGPGTLYRSIKQMLAAGWIAEAEARADPAFDDERRRYYRLTDNGRHVGTQEAARLAHLVHRAREKQLLDTPATGKGGM